MGTLVREIDAHLLMDDLIARLMVLLNDFDDEIYEIPARTGFHYEQPQAGLVE